MKNRRTHEFRELFDALPENIKDIARAKYRLFLSDPSHPSLGHHMLRDGGRGEHRAGSYVLYVTKRYRAIYVPIGDVNLWYWIGTHSDYNRLVGHK